MSGALRKMTTFLGYSEPERNDVEAEEADAYAPGSLVHAVEDSYEPYDEVEEDLTPGQEVDLRRIVTVHPSTYNEARVIGESFRDGVPVIVNLTNMSEADARRMVDFSAGLVFGLHGAIERVTPRVFLLTPATVQTDSGSGKPAQADRFFNQG